MSAVAAGEVKPSEQGKYPIKQEVTSKPAAKPLPKSTIPVVSSEVSERERHRFTGFVF